MRALPLSTSAREPRWADAFEELSFTAFALATQADDPKIAQLLGALRGVLADWETIEADRRLARGDAIAARAAVRIADAAIDVTLARVGDAVLEEVGGDREHALYRRIFPIDHERVIALGLDGELPSASLALSVLDDGDVPDAIAAHEDALRRAVTAGNQALATRSEAYAALGRLEARVEAWLETASAAARSTYNALGDLGEARGLPHRWVSSFFVDGVALG